ncbi:hypothetical protein Tco_0559500 [Tanacetum coccineum]
MRLRRDRRVLAMVAGLPCLRMAESYNGNHPEDDFTPLDTIQRSHSTVRKWIPFELKGETFKPERGDSIATQTCELSKEEFNDFLTLYPIVSKYHVMLPKSNQTIFDAPPGSTYLGLTLAKLATFFVICKAYGCEPSVDLFRGFFNLCRAEVMADSMESLKPTLFVVHPGSVAASIKDRQCRTREGLSRPPVKRKLAPGLPNVLEVKDASACHLKISCITPPAWTDHLDNHMDDELLDLHDHCYARQAVGEFYVMKDMERAREEGCEELRAKCEAAMTEFEKNPNVVALREKISILSTEVKEHKLSLDRMMLESQKWSGYQDNLLTLESKVASLVAEKERLEVVEVSLSKKLEELKQDRR